MAAPDDTAPSNENVDVPSNTSTARWLSRARRWFWLMIPLWLFLDLATKALTFAALDVPDHAGPGGGYGETVWVLDGFLRFSAHINDGAAFGLGRGKIGLILVLTLALVPVMVGIAVTNRQRGAPLWALGAVVGGALGNLYDRLFLSGVRDFIELVKPWRPDEMLWPVFNVADMAIVGGVLIYACWTLFQSEADPDAEKKKTPPLNPPHLGLHLDVLG